MTNDRRPRLDAMIRAIEEGKYDEELDQIVGAVNKRVDIRKQEVLKMVRQVFGENAKINESTGDSPSEFMKRTQSVEDHKEKLNIIKSGKWKPSEEIRTDEMPALDDPVNPDEVISAEKPGDQPLTGEFESRSPQFGSIEDEEGEKDGGEQ